MLVQITLKQMDGGLNYQLLSNIGTMEIIIIMDLRKLFLEFKTNCQPIVMFKYLLNFLFLF